MDLVTNRPGPSVQDVFASDINPPPAVMRTESPAEGHSTADLPIDRWRRKEASRNVYDHISSRID